MPPRQQICFKKLQSNPSGQLAFILFHRFLLFPFFHIFIFFSVFIAFIFHCFLLFSLFLIDLVDIPKGTLHAYS